MFLKISKPNVVLKVNQRQYTCHFIRVELLFHFIYFHFIFYFVMTLHCWSNKSLISFSCTLISFSEPVENNVCMRVCVCVRRAWGVVRVKIDELLC